MNGVIDRPATKPGNELMASMPAPSSGACLAVGIYSGLGDVICALPAFALARQDGFRVLMVMSAGLYRIAGEMVGQYLPPEDVITVQWPPQKHPASVLRLIGELRRNDVKQFLVSPHPQRHHASRKLPWLMLLLRLCGIRVAGAASDPLSFFYSRKLEVDRRLPIATREWSFLLSALARPAVPFNWDVFQHSGAGAGSAHWGHVEVSNASGLAASPALFPARPISMHIGASKPGRRLPTTTLMALIEMIGGEAPIRLLGLPQELADIKAMYAIRRSSAIQDAGHDAPIDIEFVATSLVNVLTIVKNSRCLVSMDSAFAHIAAAFGVPQIVVFGPSDPEANRPVSFVPQHLIVQQKLKLECQPCGLHTCIYGDFRCMGLIEAQQIYAAIQALSDQALSSPALSDQQAASAGPMALAPANI